MAIRDAHEDGLEEGMEKGLFTSVKSLMETMNMKIDDAFEILKVPEEYRPGIRNMVTT